MAKGIVGNAADAAKAVAKTALGAAATAAATVVIENLARSIAKKSGKPIPQSTSENPMPVVEEAVRQLLTAAPADRKRPKRAPSRRAKSTKKPSAVAKKVRPIGNRARKAARRTAGKPRKKR